jgi:short-subunit dehydrogenase
MSAQTVTALVTGASAGLGAEFCRQLATRCDRILAVARRGERLARLQEELADRVEVLPVKADLGTVEGVTRAMEALRQQGPVDYLVNCAGFATFGQFAELPVDGQREMVGLHVDAAITLCRAAIPFMRERGRGYIINVSSIGAFVPGRGIAVYGACKAFLNFFSQSLQAELADTGIAVQALCPGYIHTEFHQAMASRGFDKGSIPAQMWMEAPQVVATSLQALDSGRVVVVPGEGNLALVRERLQRQLDALAAD